MRIRKTPTVYLERGSVPEGDLPLWQVTRDGNPYYLRAKDAASAALAVGWFLGDIVEKPRDLQIQSVIDAVRVLSPEEKERLLDLLP